MRFLTITGDLLMVAFQRRCMTDVATTRSGFGTSAQWLEAGEHRGVLHVQRHQLVPALQRGRRDQLVGDIDTRVGPAVSPPFHRDPDARPRQ